MWCARRSFEMSLWFNRIVDQAIKKMNKRTNNLEQQAVRKICDTLVKNNQLAKEKKVMTESNRL